MTRDELFEDYIKAKVAAKKQCYLPAVTLFIRLFSAIAKNDKDIVAFKEESSIMAYNNNPRKSLDIGNFEFMVRELSEWVFLAAIDK